MMPRAVLLPSRNPWPWEVNLSQVDRVAALLGLRAPVAIMLLARNTRAAGTYGGYGRTTVYSRRRPLPEPHHWIEVAPWPRHRFFPLTPEEVVYHEMTHARQCQDEYGLDYLRFFNEYNEELKKLRVSSTATAHTLKGHERYKSQRHEAEADALAKRLATMFPF